MRVVRSWVERGRGVQLEVMKSTRRPFLAPTRADAPTPTPQTHRPDPAPLGNEHCQPVHILCTQATLGLRPVSDQQACRTHTSCCSTSPNPLSHTQAPTRTPFFFSFLKIYPPHTARRCASQPPPHLAPPAAKQAGQCPRRGTSLATGTPPPHPRPCPHYQQQQPQRQLKRARQQKSPAQDEGSQRAPYCTQASSRHDRT